MKLVYKADPQKIRTLLDAGIKGPFELYVRNSNDYNVNLPNLISIHFPTRFDNGKLINLTDPGYLGEQSQKMQREII